jgi:transposase
MAKTSPAPNKVNLSAWLADVLDPIARHPAHWLDALMPWNWTPEAGAAQVVSFP